MFWEIVIKTAERPMRRSWVRNLESTKKLNCKKVLSTKEVDKSNFSRCPAAASITNLWCRWMWTRKGGELTLKNKACTMRRALLPLNRLNSSKTRCINKVLIRIKERCSSQTNSSWRISQIVGMILQTHRTAEINSNNKYNLLRNL